MTNKRTLVAVKFLASPFCSGFIVDQIVDLRNVQHKEVYSISVKNGDVELRVSKRPGLVVEVPRANIVSLLFAEVEDPK